MPGLVPFWFLVNEASYSNSLLWHYRVLLEFLMRKLQDWTLVCSKKGCSLMSCNCQSLAKVRAFLGVFSNLT